MIEALAYARAGLAGNPSDGYFGKTLSITVRDFAAKVNLRENRDLTIVPCAQDQSKYGSLNEFVADVKDHGYYGGTRLMKATLFCFVRHCNEQGIDLRKDNFTLEYASNIPRHVGLAGSSALATAALRCLMEFYGVEIQKPAQTNLLLSVEDEELGIAAGLQDRVIQVYENCVYMDFERSKMEAQGHGDYEMIDPELLPRLFVAYRTGLAEGSEVFHNRIRERWLQGDSDVIQAMEDVAAYAQEVRDLIVAGRGNEIGPLMDQNFDRRCSIYAISEANIAMVQRARSVGAHCKFTGSGGAVVGTYEDEAMYGRLQEAFANTGAEILKPRVTGA